MAIITRDMWSKYLWMQYQNIWYERCRGFLPNADQVIENVEYIGFVVTRGLHHEIHVIKKPCDRLFFASDFDARQIATSDEVKDNIRSAVKSKLEELFENASHLYQLYVWDCLQGD